MSKYRDKLQSRPLAELDTGQLKSPPACSQALPVPARQTLTSFTALQYCSPGWRGGNPAGSQELAFLRGGSRGKSRETEIQPRRLRRVCQCQWMPTESQALAAHSPTCGQFVINVWFNQTVLVQYRTIHRQFMTTPSPASLAGIGIIRHVGTTASGTGSYLNQTSRPKSAFQADDQGDSIVRIGSVQFGGEKQYQCQFDIFVLSCKIGSNKSLLLEKIQQTTENLKPSPSA